MGLQNKLIVVGIFMDRIVFLNKEIMQNICNL